MLCVSCNYKLLLVVLVQCMWLIIPLHTAHTIHAQASGSLLGPLSAWHPPSRSAWSDTADQPRGGCECSGERDGAVQVLQTSTISRHFERAAKD